LTRRNIEFRDRACVIAHELDIWRRPLPVSLNPALRRPFRSRLPGGVNGNTGTNCTARSGKSIEHALRRFVLVFEPQRPALRIVKYGFWSISAGLRSKSITAIAAIARAIHAKAVEPETVDLVALEQIGQIACHVFGEGRVFANARHQLIDDTPLEIDKAPFRMFVKCAKVAVDRDIGDVLYTMRISRLDDFGNKIPLAKTRMPPADRRIVERVPLVAAIKDRRSCS